MAEDISKGIWPSFHWMGAGYPLLISLSRLFSDTSFSVVLLQQLLSLLAVGLSLYAFIDNVKKFLFIALFGIIYLLSDTVIKWELAVFPDSAIASGLIISTAFFYLSLIKNGRYYPYFLGITLFYVIALRSSSVYLIPIVVFVAIVYFRFHLSKHAYRFVLTFLISCTLLATYNLLFSQGNKFSIITYGRLDPSYTTINAFVDSTTAKPKPPKIVNNSVNVGKVFTYLDPESDLYTYLYSWKPEKLSIAIINCRHGIIANKVNQDSISICNKGNWKYAQCTTISKSNYGNVSTDSMVALINGYNIRDLSFKNFLRYQLVYHGNIKLNYNQAYWGVLNGAYTTTASKENFVFHFYNNDKEIRHIAQYALKDNYSRTDYPDFDKQFTKLKSSFIFKAYDIFNELVSKRIFRNYIWLILSAVGLLYYIYVFIKSSFKDMNAVLPIFIGCILLGSSTVFIIFGDPLPRYSFTTEFGYYLISLLFVYDLCKMFAINKILKR